MLRITAGGFSFIARLEEEDAPETVAAFRRLLPLESRIIHVRWSGEAGLDPVRRPRPRARPRERDVLSHIPARSCSTRVASPRPRSCSPTGTSTSPPRRAQLAGNHFATIVEGNENLRALGKSFLWEGAQEIAFTEV